MKRADLFDRSVSTERFPEEFQGSFFIAPLCDEAFEYLTLVVDSPSEVVPHTINLDENFVEVPPPVTEMTHRLHPAATDLHGKNHPEPVPPKPHSFMGDVDPALMEQVLDVPE
jgi:hypothetical protein